jgi:hypothetical protein
MDKSVDPETGKQRDMVDIFTKTLEDRPAALADIWSALHDTFAALFDTAENPGQYAAFRALRPSLKDYGRLVRALTRAYGVSLGEAFASPVSSKSGGTTPNPTSPDSTDSTPDGSGADPEPATAS